MKRRSSCLLVLFLTMVMTPSVVRGATVIDAVSFIYSVEPYNSTHAWMIFNVTHVVTIYPSGLPVTNTTENSLLLNQWNATSYWDVNLTHYDWSVSSPRSDGQVSGFIKYNTSGEVYDTGNFQNAEGSGGISNSYDFYIPSNTSYVDVVINHTVDRWPDLGDYFNMVKGWLADNWPYILGFVGLIAGMFGYTIVKKKDGNELQRSTAA